jgi:hypothetical protein
LEEIIENPEDLKKEKEEEVYSDGKIRNDLNDWLELANT